VDLYSPTILREGPFCSITCLDVFASVLWYLRFSRKSHLFCILFILIYVIFIELCILVSNTISIMMILLIVISKMMLVSFNSNIMLPLLEQELLTIPDQMTSDTNCPLLVANCLFCCFRGSSKSIIHMLSKDVPILT
jgi:hypothetical protein